MSESIKHPKVFISYSWSPPSQKDWALRLAHDLTENGVHVKIDIWDLAPGDDIYKYMESMLSDKDISKVIMICNASYADKANKREKGVGTEAQIISAEIYSKNQNKFISILSEIDDNGEPYLPIYCQNRRYISMADEEYGDGLDELLRTIHNKPLHPRPQVGSMPEFSSSTVAKISISSIARRACKSLRERKSDALNVTEECLSSCVGIMEKLPVKNFPEQEVIISHVNEFLPVRDDVVKVFQNMARHLPQGDAAKLLHVFFEKLLVYYDPHRNTTEAVRTYRTDHIKFLVHEMFLYAIAALIKTGKFEDAAHLMGKDYYVPDICQFPMRPFSKIMVPLEIERWNIDLDVHENSSAAVSRANALVKRATIRDLSLIDIQQADLVLMINSAHTSHSFWRFSVMLYANQHHIFEIFARAQSKEYFNKMKILLGVERLSDLPDPAVLTSFMVREGLYRSNIPRAMGWDTLNTQP